MEGAFFIPDSNSHHHNNSGWFAGLFASLSKETEGNKDLELFSQSKNWHFRELFLFSAVKSVQTHQVHFIMKKSIIFLISNCILFISWAQQEDSSTIQVISTLDETVSPGRSVAYSAAFRSAWTMLKEDIVEENIRIRETPEPVIVPLLNDRPYRPASDQGWITNTRLAGDSIICDARFRLNIHFTIPFEVMDWRFQSSGPTQGISCFGISKGEQTDAKNEMRKQVAVYDYRSPDDFIVCIRGSDPHRELILAKMEFTQSLHSMIGIVNDRIIQSYPEEVTPMDELIIPQINLRARHSYSELLGKHLANNDFEDYFFVQADHNIEFTLNQAGAFAEASGTVTIMKGPKPRIYAFDKPFMVIVREKGAREADLVLWVTDTEFLIGSE